MSLFSEEALYLAYRKAKADLFFERSIPNAKKFAGYEDALQEQLGRLLGRLNDTQGKRWYLDRSFIGGVSFVPKSLELPQELKIACRRPRASQQKITQHRPKGSVRWCFAPARTMHNTAARGPAVSLRRIALSSAWSPNLKTIANLVRRVPQPLVLRCRNRIVANADSIGLVASIQTGERLTLNRDVLLAFYDVPPGTGITLILASYFSLN